MMATIDAPGAFHDCVRVVYVLNHVLKCVSLGWHISSRKYLCFPGCAQLKMNYNPQAHAYIARTYPMVYHFEFCDITTDSFETTLTKCCSLLLGLLTSTKRNVAKLYWTLSQSRLATARRLLNR